MKILDESVEKDLLVRLKKKDESAFNAIYYAFSKPLYLKVLKMVKDEDVADEIIQELFIKLWNYREKVDEEKSFQSLLYTIAQNLVFNHFRKLASDHKMVQALLLQENLGPLAGDKILENKATGELIEKAINQLSPQRKQAFNLCKIEGKSYEEASKIMGVSVATINSHITQALQVIRAYIVKNQDLGVLFLSLYLIG